MTDAQGWHLDKKVPIAIMATGFFQTCAIVWWASGIEHRLQAAETTAATHTVKIESIQNDKQGELQRLSRVEQSLSDIKEFMARIDSKLDNFERRK